MGLFNNIKNIFSKSLTTIQQKVSKTLVFNTALGTAHWSNKDYHNFAKETYMKNVISFRCIFYIASNIAQVKWGLFKTVGNKREEITNDPINKILKRANPQESFVYLIQKAVSYLLIAGNSFFERVGATTGINKGIPRELYIIRPDRMKINTNKDTGQLESYEYGNTGMGSLGIKFSIDPITLKSDILHVKMFHPLDDYFGMSITEPTAREIDSSNEAIEWQKKMFENEGRPGMIINVAGFLSDEQWNRLEKQLKDNHGGFENAGKNLIIEGESASNASPYSWSPKEMDWIESNRELARRICLGYGVPPMLLGIPGDNTYSNLKEARIAFWEETVIYYLDLLAGELNNWFYENDDKFIAYDLSQIPAMAYKHEMIWSRIKDATFLTINEKREAAGYEKYPDPAADMLFAAFGQVPLEQMTIDNNNNNQNAQNELDQQNQENQDVQKLVNQGIDEKIAMAMVGSIY
jgi:HK97 family phage portal protein